MLARAGHLGVWAGLYAAAAFVCMMQLAGLWTGSWNEYLGAASIALIGTGAYALDRVKLRNSWIDSADLMAQPMRYAFLLHHASRVRCAAALMLVAGGVVGVPVSRWAPVASLCAAIGVVAYAPWPRRREGGHEGIGRPRTKDILWVKNTYVACGVTGLAFLTVTALASEADHPTGWLRAMEAHANGLMGAVAVVFSRVWCDAVICDIDDEAADRAHGTDTLPTMLGGDRTWIVTGVARLFLAAATVVCVWCAWPARGVWAGANLAGFVLLRARRPERVRDLVDLRLVAEAALVCGLLAW